MPSSHLLTIASLLDSIRWTPANAAAVPFSQRSFEPLAFGDVSIDFEHAVAEQLHSAVDEDFPSVTGDVMQFT
jgi:hypothetical protein